MGRDPWKAATKVALSKRLMPWATGTRFYLAVHDHVTNTPNHYPDRALELGYLLLSIGHWLRVLMGPQRPSISGLSHEAARESPQEHTAGAGNKMPLDWCAQERWEEGTGAGHPQPMSQVDLGRRACLRVPPSSQG